MDSKTPTEYSARLREIAGRLRQLEGSAPPGMTADIFTLYREMFRASFAASLVDAFPESCRHLSPEIWEALVDNFLAGGECPNPSFHAVPDAFFRFVIQHFADDPPLPDYLPALLHWEWLTLTLAIAPNDIEECCAADLEQLPMQLANTARLQHYPFAVHLAVEPPQTPSQRDCYLLVYRHRDGAVFSRELELPEARLAAALANTARTATDAHALAFPAGEYAVAWARKRLQEWCAAGILQTTTPNSCPPPASPSPP
ncbi:putative DNA-binding domain-containing protein [Acidithiobacillus sp. IBUN Pt1247-S3]|uniref:HvfC/BufC family peptide modification chaperone n=1 Tax=Acidithiobacillus sp. IBUN Pt1247-S3 TaxID=3166642 RepID=UPI0034E38195